MRSRFEIQIENRQKRVRVSETSLKRYVVRMLKGLGWERVGLSIRIVGDAGIRRLNRCYRGQDRATDVLAFGQMEGRNFPQPCLPFLGDIVVSIDTARSRAPEFGNRCDEELLTYICHGILHLMGDRDDTVPRSARMERKQEAVLQSVLGKSWRSRRQKRLF